MTAGCPKPNGVFRNEAEENKSVKDLQGYFKAPGFETPATSYPGGRENDEPIPLSAYAINILGGVKNGVRQDYKRVPGERFTLELRPREHNNFLIGVKSSLGLSDQAEGYLIILSGIDMHCENGSLKAYSKTLKETIFDWELYVEAGSGDIVIRYPARDRYAPNPAGQGFIKAGIREERFTRFKRIGN